MDTKQKFFKKTWPILFGVLFIGIVVFSQFYDINITKERTSTSSPVSQINYKEFSVDLNNLTEEEVASVKAFLKFKKIKTQIIPSGVPNIYGRELAVNFDQVQESMNKMRVFGPTYGKEQKITLTGKDKERYINISSQTSCQYCCGAEALVREDGQAACGCAHSIAMRGLAAYLIKNHPELSDEEILTELNTWKKSFFPKQTLTATLQNLKESGEKDIEQVLEEFPDFLPQMVGGC